MKKEVKCPACGSSFMVVISGGMSAVYCHFCEAKIQLAS